MAEPTPIRTALISVYHKDGLDEILSTLHALGVRFLSTGGTHAFIESLGYPCDRVEDVTGYPSILGGRVKTLHPLIFGGILARRNEPSVDLYPFEQTVAEGGTPQEIIEKIDIGGISLIRAAAKNFADVAIVPSKAEYPVLLSLLKKHGARTTEAQRRELATRAFAVSSHYDTAINKWFENK